MAPLSYCPFPIARLRLNKGDIRKESLLGFADVSVAVCEKSQFHGFFPSDW